MKWWMACALCLAATGLALAQDEPPPDGDDPGAGRGALDTQSEFEVDWGDLPDSFVTACFAVGTPQWYVDLILERVDFQNALVPPSIAYQIGSNWTSQGTPFSLTWSFVPDGLNIPNGVGEGAGPSTLFANLDADFAAQGGRATWIARFQAVFDRWSAMTGVTYTRVTFGGNDWDDGAGWSSSGSAGLRGDIRIAAKQIDNANGVLAYNQFPGGGSGGNMVLDEDENWGSSSSTNRFLRNTVAHEHGHGIGLSHVCPANGTKLMEPFLNLGFDTLRHDDIRAGQRNYGDPYEKPADDNTSANANDLGAIALGTTLSTICAEPSPSVSNSSICSVDGNGDVDYFKFTVPSNCTATVTVTPLGLNYASYAQDSACDNTTNNTNSLAMANLNVQLIGTNGTTVLGTADTQPSGTAETLSGVVLAGAGTYFIRVYEGDSPTQSQLYDLSLNVQGALECPQISTHPQSQSICQGDGLTLTVSATGSAPLSYQWRFEGADLPGETASTLSYDPGELFPDGPYDVVVSNGCGSATSNVATVTILGGPNVQTDPQGDSVCVGEMVTFTVVASGMPNYQWRKNGLDIGGATSSSYTINPVTMGDAATYSCYVFNDCGADTSAGAVLTVSDGALITDQPDSQNVCPGANVMFSVTATGATGYQWKKDGNALLGETGAALSLTGVDGGDVGSYTCDVTGNCGVVESNAATLSLKTAVAITQQPTNKKVKQGSTVMFSVSATGSPTITYQWRKGGIDIGGETGSTLTLTNVTAADSGNYDCVVTNDCGSVNSAVAKLTVRALVTQGLGQTLP